MLHNLQKIPFFSKVEVLCYAASIQDQETQVLPAVEKLTVES